MSDEANISAHRGGLPESVSGVQLAQGVGVQPARGFWADAWSQVFRRPAAVAGLAWVGIVAFFAVFAPVLATGHPLLMWNLAPGAASAYRSPLIEHLTGVDVVLLAAVILGGTWIAVGWARGRAARNLGHVLTGLAAALVVILITTVVQDIMQSRSPPRWALWLKSLRAVRLLGGWPTRGVPGAALVVTAGAVAAAFAVTAILPVGRLGRRLMVAAAACAAAGVIAIATWGVPFEQFPYQQQEAAGEIQAVYTLVPWSPQQRFSDLSRVAPMTTFGEARRLAASDPAAGRRFVLGTDAYGADVLAQVLHACRLSISIGLVSTGVALVIGVTLGALMGYFGGWVDLALYRVVEVFQAVPVIFLLIVAVAVLPPEARNTYVMMAIIGCFTWTNMARFTRAEFFKLRNQDFVQAARAVGLPLRSVLFRHMLPNGVAPVLVDTSFAIAAAINIEAVLSYLNLGPIGQASWGKLLASAVTPESEFKWWLAVFPGVAIFLTVLSYNLIGETLRDAIDPRLKKARV